MRLPDILNEENSEKIDYLHAIIVNCNQLGLGNLRMAANIFFLIAGGVANTALLWLFFKERRALSASQVLGGNLAFMDLLYLIIIPVELLHDRQMEKINITNNSVCYTPPSGVKISKDIFTMFNLIGCPLLLACMCVERYMAVVRPVLYLRLRRWEYRVAVSVAAWMLTLSFCLVIGLRQDMVQMMVPVSIFISFLFLLMLASLGGVVRSLRQQSPALTSSGNQTHRVSCFKRRALGNVLAVVAPSVMSYLPILVMFPVVLYEFYWNNALSDAMCILFELSQLFPKIGLLIGPLFYLSKAKQMYVLCRMKEK